jgi:hypothetical protein
MTTMGTAPTIARGPPAATVIDDLTEWLVTEGYTPTMIPQILGVARGIGAWMEDHDIEPSSMSTTVLEQFQNFYGPGSPGHTTFNQAISAVRGFLCESHLRTDATAPRKPPKPLTGKAAIPVNEPVRRELDDWAA